MLFTKKENPTQEPEKMVVPENSEMLIFTHDEINLLRECMKRTEDYYKGLLLLKQDWNPEKNEEAIAFIKVKLRMIDALQKKRCMPVSRNTTEKCSEQKPPDQAAFAMRWQN